MTMAVVVACADGSAERAAPVVQHSLAAQAWLQSIDSAAKKMKPYEFEFPSESLEGGVGRLYRLADSSVRIDVDHLGESGRLEERFYARGMELQVAVMVDSRYDRPMSGRVARQATDTVWFVHDTAARWIDSTRAVHATRDSVMIAHGAEVRSEYLWAISTAGKAPAQRRSQSPH